MNKKLFGVLALTTIILFSSCKKIIDKYFPGHGNDKETCRITEITQESYNIGEQRIGQFHYSNKGLLDSVTFDQPMGSAGPQFYYFKYDNNKRLIEYRSDYTHEPGDYYILHKYVYNGNTIIQDSTFGRVAGTYIIVYDLEYDNQSRIIKQTGLLVEADGEPANEVQEPVVYEYNEDGNLVHEYMSEIDDKKSFLRTNPIFMFIQRNYSVNNSYKANEYNEAGLPLGFDLAPVGSFLNWGFPAEIKYQCN